MNKALIYRGIWLGFFSWLVPFTISFFCYGPRGQLIMEYSTFKSIMIVSGAISGSYLLFQFFKAVNGNFERIGFMVGLLWFMINILLDSLILVPLMKMNFPDYFSSIGLGYISIPAISISMGYLLGCKYDKA